MNRRLAACALAMAALGTPAGAPSAEPAERLSLADCVRIAQQNNQEAERASARVEEAEASRKVARGRFGPVLQWEAGVQRWAEPTEIEFAMPATIPGFNIPPISMEVQEATTMQMSFTVAQPVTSLWAIAEGYRAASLGEQIARLETGTVGHDVEQKVADAYFQALTAERFVEIAGLAVGLIEAHVNRARVLHAHELIAKNLVLEAEVRLAQARADLIKARGGLSLARSNLAFQMGLPADREVAPARLEPGTDVPSAAAVEAAVVDGAAERKELAVARLRVEQAEAGYRAAWALMLPQVNVLASAQYAKGSSFQKEAAYFVGAQASWTFWEWGAKYYGIDEAKARVRQARSGVEQLGEGMKLEVKKASIELKSAREKLDVMRSSVAQAEENLRIVERRFEQDADTSTDVLDAQMLLAKARMDAALAYHEYLQARVALRKALGHRPTAGNLGG